MAGHDSQQVITMKLRILFAIGMAMAGSAWAADPVDPAALGSLDGMLATCHEVNPSGQAAYDALREAMIGEQPEGALEALVQTPEYQKAYAEARKKTDAASSDSARHDCAQLVAALGPRAHHVDRLYKSTKKK